MIHLRALAAGAALGLGLAVTPTTSAQPAIDQRPPPPADPASPGALVVPDSAKEQMNEMRKEGENPDKTTRDRGRRDSDSGGARSSSPGNDRSAPVPPASDGSKQ
jgi:hypothetical protein